MQELVVRCVYIRGLIADLTDGDSNASSISLTLIAICQTVKAISRL